MYRAKTYTQLMELHHLYGQGNVAMGGETYILVQLVNRHETEDTDCFKRPGGGSDSIQSRRNIPDIKARDASS